MKNLLLIALIFFAGTFYAQKDTSQYEMISKAKLIHFKSINELVKDIPKDCASIKIAVMHNGQKGKVIVNKLEDLELDEKMLHYFKHAHVHEKFIVDIHGTCPNEFVKVQTFKVEE
jgi:hypothetical protein